MIAITPEIIGPGIEEEYRDALAAIDAIGAALGNRELTNDTPEGRLLLNVIWIEQEIDAGRLPIPVDPSFVGTVFRLVGSNELANIAGLQSALGRLWLVLKGYGLIKRRHIPVLIAMIDDYVADAETCADLTDGDRKLIADLRAEARNLREGAKPRADTGEPSYSSLSSDALNACIDRGYSRLRNVSTSLLDGWRPLPARKPPLAAPVAGLPAEAPTLPADRDTA